MNPETKALFDEAEQAIRHLITACRKRTPLYLQNPRAVAQVSRTSKWLLNAIERLNRELATGTSQAAS